MSELDPSNSNRNSIECILLSDTNFNYDYEALEDTDNDDTLDNIAK